MSDGLKAVVTVVAFCDDDEEVLGHLEQVHEDTLDWENKTGRQVGSGETIRLQNGEASTCWLGEKDTVEIEVVKKGEG